MIILAAWLVYSAATVHIPKPPPNRTLAAIEARKAEKRKHEAELTVSAIHQFEEKMKMVLPPNDDGYEGNESSTYK